jgi:pimeloyl-ACP methyl ester carboxylesterase
MATVQLSDGMTAYELAGPDAGPLVLLVHGGTIPMWTWDCQMAALHGAGFRTLRYDMYGKGHSAAPAVQYDRALFRRQLQELLEALAVPLPLHLAGFSFGGAVAAGYCVAFPKQVASLALIAPVLRFEEGHPMLRTARLPVAGQLFVQYVVLKKAAERAARLWAGSPDADRYGRLFQEQLLQPGFDRAFASFLRSDALDDYSETYRQAGKVMRNTLLVWGDHDTDIRRSHIVRVRDWLPQADYHELAGAGHGAMFQAADRVNEILVRHLQMASRQA